MKDCPKGKIYNPTTKRCILINGKTAKNLEKIKMIINKSNDKYQEKKEMKSCSSNKILNPETNRCVSKYGIIGKKILSQKYIKYLLRTKYLNWENNSCYMDSLFMALFHIKSSFIEKEFLNAPINDFGNRKLKEIGEMIRKQLISIYNTISGISNEHINSCSLIRIYLDNYYRLLKKIKPKLKIISSNDNWTTTQLDIFELLEFLKIIFNIRNTTKIIDANNPPYNTDFINMIPIDFLLNDVVNINDIYPSYETIYNLDAQNQYIDKNGIKHYTYVKKTEIIKAPFLIIRISRNIGSTKLNTKIIPKTKLILKENSSRLILNSIIIHYGNNYNGHYISLIKKENNIWYEYNDLNPLLKPIGTLSDIIRHKNYTNNIVGLIYAKNK